MVDSLYFIFVLSVHLPMKNTHTMVSSWSNLWVRYIYANMVLTFFLRNSFVFLLDVVRVHDGCICEQVAELKCIPLNMLFCYFSSYKSF
jgi:hypothetical protein